MTFSYNKVLSGIIIFLIIIKSGGIVNLFNPNNLILTLILLFCSIPNCLHIKKEYFFKFLLIVLFFVFNLIVTKTINSQYGKLIFQFFVIMLSINALRKTEDIQGVFETVLFIIVIHSLINFGCQFINLPLRTLEFSNGEGNKNFSTFFYILYYWKGAIHTVGNISFLRNQGFFWEPGIFQIFTNFYLFLLLFTQRNRRFFTFKLFISLFALILSFSTSGFIVFSLMMLVKLRQMGTKGLIILCLMIPIFLTIIMPNILFKFSGNGSGSFFLRMISLYIPFRVFIDNPLFGVGLRMDDFVWYEPYLKKYGTELSKMLQFPYEIVEYSILGQSTSSNALAKFGAQFGLVGLSILVFCLLKGAEKISKHKYLLLTMLIINTSVEPMLTMHFYMFMIFIGISRSFVFGNEHRRINSGASVINI